MEREVNLNLMPGTIEDLAAIRSLLLENGLPHSDLTPQQVINFLVAYHGNRLVGAVGLETYDLAALLRSLVVHHDFRCLGIGARLVHEIEHQAISYGVSQLYLLTTTAEGYFTRLGYHRIERAMTPPTIQATSEFRSLCPASACCLQKSLPIPGSRHRAFRTPSDQQV